MPKKPQAPHTLIIRNGPHAQDEPPASIEELLALLEKHPLAPWSSCRPLKKTPGATFFCGELRTCCHPFSILSSEPAGVRCLTQALLPHCERFQVMAEETGGRRARAPRSRSRRETRAK